MDTHKRKWSAPDNNCNKTTEFKYLGKCRKKW